MDVDLLTLLFTVLPANMVCMRLLVKCGKVCKAFQGMAVAMQDKEDGTSCTARYCRLAQAFHRGLPEEMMQRYRTELGAAKARRRVILEADEFDEDLDQQIHAQLETSFESAVRYLSGALQEYLLHKHTMLLSVWHLSRLTIAYNEEIVMPLRLTRLCQWPLLKILQAHPTKLWLGSSVISLLGQFSDLEIDRQFGYESIDREEDRLTARGIVSGFLANFSQPQAIALQPAEHQPTFIVRRMLEVGNEVLTWIDLGTVFHATDSTEQ